MPLYIAQSGDLEWCHRCLTDEQTDFERIDLLSSLSSKSGALVTQQQMSVMSVSLQMSTFLSNKINEKITISLLKSDFRGYFICMFKIVSNQKELPNSICNP